MCCLCTKTVNSYIKCPLVRQEIICGRRKILTLDCNEECIVTGSICRIQGYTGECMQSTLIVDIVTGDVVRLNFLNL